MRMPPMNKAILIHKIKWTPVRLAEKDLQSYVIDKVRLDWKAWFNPLNPQQSVGGNWRLFWDSHWSTKVNGEMPKFAVGDTIEFMIAPLTPKLCTIANVTPLPDVDGKTIHHLELTLN